MAKKKAKRASKPARSKTKSAKKPAAKKPATKKSAAKKIKPAKQAVAQKSSLKTRPKAAAKKTAKKGAKKKSPPVKNVASRQQSERLANHVRIDHVTQGIDGHETPADRLSIHYDDFLWIYVEAELPGGAIPQGEYAKVVGGVSAAPQHLGPPEEINGQYRFSVIHFSLSPDSTYQFRFADDLASPTYQDQWEVVTLPA